MKATNVSCVSCMICITSLTFIASLKSTPVLIRRRPYRRRYRRCSSRGSWIKQAHVSRFPETRTPLWACFACRVPSTFGNEGAAISVCHKKRLACLVFAIGEYFISSFATRYIVKHLPSVFRNFDVYLNASGDHAQEHWNVFAEV